MKVNNILRFVLLAFVLLSASFAFAAAPNITNVNPVAGSFTNNREQPVTSTIVDTNTGINAGTLRMIVNGVIHQNGLSPNVDFNSATGVFRFTPTPGQGFAEGSTVRVTIQASDNNSNTSNQDTNFVVDTIAPSKILDLTGVWDTNANVVRLDWNQPSFTNAPVSFYTVARFAQSFDDAQFDSHVLATNILDTNYTDANITTNSRYFYKVRSRDAAGNNSEPSNEARVDVNFTGGSGSGGSGGGSDDSGPQVSVLKIGDDITVEFFDKEVSVEKGSQINLPVRVINNERQGVCFEVEGDVDDEDDEEDVRVELPDSLKSRMKDRFNSFQIGRAGPFSEGDTVVCMNPGEVTAFDITVIADPEATSDEYDLTLDLEFFELFDKPSRTVGKVLEFVDSLRFEFEVEVLDEGESPDKGVDFVDSASAIYSICKEDSSTNVEIELENEGSDQDDVKLYADSVGGLLVRFDPDEIDIEDTRHVRMNIYTTPTTKAGLYKVPVYARNDLSFVKKSILVNVLECGTVPFFLVTNTGAFDVKPGKTAEVEYTIVNRGNLTQTIDIVAASDLPVEVLPSEIVLPPAATVKGVLRIATRSTDSVGPHAVELYAVNEQGDYRALTLAVNVGESIAFESKTEKAETKKVPAFLPQKVVRKKGQKLDQPPFFGLFTLGANPLVGLLVLALIVLAAVYVMKKGKEKPASFPGPKWVKR